MFKVQLPGSELRTRPFCFSCKAETGTLKTCSRCKLIQYCSVDCQRHDFKDHKEFCKVAKKSIEEEKQQAEQTLTQMRVFNIAGKKRSLIPLLFPNDKLRCSFINHLISLGIKSRDERILGLAFSYCSHVVFQKVLRSHEVMSCQLPFLCLYLNQATPALKLAKHHQQFLENIPVTIDDNQIYEWHHFDHIVGSVTAAIIKCRIIQQSLFITAGFETFLEVIEGHRLRRSRPAIEKIQKYLGNLDAVTLNRQKDHFIRYLNRIEKANLIFLKSLINPGPLLAIEKIGSNDRTEEGSLTEALTLLKIAGPLIQENDYAMKMIMKKVGENPTYPTSGKPTRVM